MRLFLGRPGSAGLYMVLDTIMCNFDLDDGTGWTCAQVWAGSLAGTRACVCTDSGMSLSDVRNIRRLGHGQVHRFTCGHKLRYWHGRGHAYEHGHRPELSGGKHVEPQLEQT